MLLNTYLDAININNSGVSHMEAGQFSQARNEFKIALDTIRVAVVKAQQFVTIFNKNSGSSSLCPSRHLQYRLHDSNHDMCERVFVYKHAMRIETDVIDPLEITLSNESAVIVYNLALAYHMMCLEGGAECLLGKSLQFYLIAYAINVRVVDSQLKLSGASLLNMAILNNSGQINHELLDYAASRQCFQQLSSHLRSLSLFGLDNVLEQKDCQGFFLNLMLSEPKLAAAA